MKIKSLVSDTVVKRQKPIKIFHKVVCEMLLWFSSEWVQWDAWAPLSLVLKGNVSCRLMKHN